VWPDGVDVLCGGVSLTELDASPGRVSFSCEEPTITVVPVGEAR
jgi:hypothetical protein